MRAAGCYEFVEAFSVSLVEKPIVAERNANYETALNPAVEVDEMWIDVIEEGTFRREAKGDCHAPAERLHEPTPSMCAPQ